MALVARSLIDEGESAALAVGMMPAAVAVTATLTHRIEDVEPIWRRLMAMGVESPGQSYDFIKLWTKDRRIRAEDQFYIVGLVDGVPVALMALHKRFERGVRALTWFPGSHVGCNAPIADIARLAAMSPAQRGALWQAMIGQIRGADIVYLRAVPAEAGGVAGLFDELGTLLPVETLYRTQFASWEECDRVQRSKSRRKHDRQQGDRLNALGQVEFEEIRSGGDARCAIEIMFQQRAARFKAMGIRDPFVGGHLLDFYHAAIGPDSGIDVRLHVLRLNGEIVATRYNIVHADRMFCLISSMSDDPAIQGGSPGKQCLLRVMQTVFDSGFRVFDMGAGFTDEKRHWCNVEIALRHHYVPLTRFGRVALAVHSGIQSAKARIKANRTLMSWRRLPAQWMSRFSPKKSEASSD